MEWMEKKKDKKRKGWRKLMEEEGMSRHLENRGLQDEWCKDLPLEMFPTQDKNPIESSQVSQKHSYRVSLL